MFSRPPPPCSLPLPLSVAKPVQCVHDFDSSPNMYLFEMNCTTNHGVEVRFPSVDHMVPSGGGRGPVGTTRGVANFSQPAIRTRTPMVGGVALLMLPIRGWALAP